MYFWTRKSPTFLSRQDLDPDIGLFCRNFTIAVYSTLALLVEQQSKYAQASGPQLEQIKGCLGKDALCECSCYLRREGNVSAFV